MTNRHLVRHGYPPFKARWGHRCSTQEETETWAELWSGGPGLSSGRGRQHNLCSCQVAAVNPTRYVGEYGVFADEPRAATLVAQTQVFCWVSSKEAFRFELNRLPKVVCLGMCSEAHVHGQRAGE